MTVYAFARHRTNGHLIRDAVVPLGYLRKDWPTLDPTWGKGRWWKLWRPDDLVAHDLRTLDGVDFRDLPHADASFRVAAYDPPYKLNGTAAKDSDVDSQYGVDGYMHWRDRHRLCREGAAECHRVIVPGGYLLWKCQDQVCGGHVRWQTVEFTEMATRGLGMELVDRFDMIGGREQPPRKRKDGEPSTQQHARRNASTLLVFRKKPTKGRKGT